MGSLVASFGESKPYGSLLTANFLYLFIAPHCLQAHELIDGFVVVHMGSDAIAVEVVEGELVPGVPRSDGGSEILVGADVLDCFGTPDAYERGGDELNERGVGNVGGLVLLHERGAEEAELPGIFASTWREDGHAGEAVAEGVEAAALFSFDGARAGGLPGILTVGFDAAAGRGWGERHFRISFNAKMARIRWDSRQM